MWGKHTAKTTTHVATSHRRRSARQELDMSPPRVMGASGSHRLPLVLEPAAAAPEPSAAAQVLSGAILLEVLLVLRDHVAVDRLPNEALRDKARAASK